MKPVRACLWRNAFAFFIVCFGSRVPSFENRQLNGNEKVRHHSATKYPTQLVAHMRPWKAVLNQCLFFKSELNSWKYDKNRVFRHGKSNPKTVFPCNLPITSRKNMDFPMKIAENRRILAIFNDFQREFCTIFVVSLRISLRFTK